jgi:hypothetical protein
LLPESYKDEMLSFLGKFLEGTCLRLVRILPFVFVSITGLCCGAFQMSVISGV